MIRRVLGGLLAGLALLLVTITILVASIDDDTIRGWLARTLSSAAGAPVELPGPLQVRWWPTPGLTAHDVRLRSAQLDIRAARIDVSVDLSAALSGRLQARHILVVRPVVRVVAAERPAAGGAGSTPDLHALPVSQLAIRDLEIHISDDTSVDVARIDVLRDPADAGLRLTLKGSPKHGPDLDGRLSVDGSAWRLSQMHAALGGAQLSGHLELDVSAASPVLKGELSSASLELGPMAAGRQGGAPVPDQAVALQWLQWLDLDLVVRVSRLDAGRIALRDVRVPLEAVNGTLSANAGALLAGGSLTLEIEIDPEDRWRIRSRLENADAGVLLNALGSGSALPGGGMSAQAELETHGRSTGSLIAGLAGTAQLRVHGLAISGRAIDQAAGDIVGGLIGALAGAGGTTQLLCGVGRFQVRDGVLHADRSIGAQTDAVNILGGGSASLPANRLALLFRTWPRGGLGIGAGTLAGTVGVAGPIDAPRLELSGESLLKAGASVGAAIATGGLSIIAQGLLEHGKGDDPCAQALAQGTSRQAASGSGKSSVTETIDSSAEKAGRSIGRTLEKAGSFLEGLLPKGGGGNARPGASADQ